MSHTLDIDQRELALKQELTDLALTDPEQFRLQASNALLLFTRKNRRLLTSIETRSISAYDVLGTWSDQLQPLTMQLQSKRTDKTFRASIKKQLILSDNELDAKITELIDDRFVEVETAFLDTFYESRSDQRVQAKRLLQRADSELRELLTRITECILYATIARDNNVAIVDPHAPVLRRFSSSRKVQRERRAARRIRKERLNDIAKREKELAAVGGGILADVAEKGWDLVLIISMRNQYDKRVSALPAKDNNAVKRLALFEKLTQQFRDEYVESASGAKTSLEQTRKLSTEVDSLLLQIFDLSTVQKNQLLLHSKEHRELMAERQAILSSSRR